MKTCTFLFATLVATTSSCIQTTTTVQKKAYYYENARFEQLPISGVYTGGLGRGNKMVLLLDSIYITLPSQSTDFLLADSGNLQNVTICVPELSQNVNYVGRHYTFYKEFDRLYKGD